MCDFVHYYTLRLLYCTFINSIKISCNFSVSLLIIVSQKHSSNSGKREIIEADNLLQTDGHSLFLVHLYSTDHILLITRSMILLSLDTLLDKYMIHLHPPLTWRPRACHVART